MKRAFFVLFFLIPLSTMAGGFSRTLVVGSVGDDVVALQRILNSDPLTKVASTGPGSPGNETSYFGELTKRAVMSFQSKYAPETLFPAGVYKPTGVVGTFTRAKLNSLEKLPASSVPDSPLPQSVQSAVPPLVGAIAKPNTKDPLIMENFFATKSKPLLFNLSRYEAKQGQTVVVNGSGFLPTNNSVILSSSVRVENLSSIDGSTLSFTVPTTASNGTYNLHIQNKNGSTYDSSYGDFFTVADNPRGPPTITSVSTQTIDVADIGKPIVFYGDNFDSTNQILSSVGNISGVRSDGKKIEFSLSSFPEIKKLIDAVKYVNSADLYFFVVNKYGVTSTPQKVILKIK